MNPPTATPQPWEENRVRVLESATDGFFALNSEWRFTYFSADAAKVLRVPQQGMVGEVIWSKFPEMVDSDFARALRQTATQQAGSSVITYCPDHHCWYETRSFRTPEGITVYVRDITEQRRIEEERTHALQEAQRQRRMFAATIGNTPDFHFVLSLEGRLIYANPPLLSFWEKSLEQVIGRNIREIGYSTELVERLLREIPEVIAARQPHGGKALFAYEGETRVYDYGLAPVIDPEGVVEAVSVAARDFTRRKQHEDAIEPLVSDLKYEQENLANVFRQAPSLMCVLRGPDHIIELANDLFCEHAGLRHLAGRKFREVLPELEKQTFPGVLDRVYRTGMEYVAKGTPIMLQRESGQPPEERFVDFTYQPIRDAGNVVTGILIQGVDLTEHKRAEEELRASDERHRKAALEAASSAEANAKFRVFFEQGAEFAGVLSLDGKVIEANRQGLEACGYTSDEVIQKAFWECGWWNRSPELQEMVRGGVQEAVSGKIFRKETKYHTADGSVRFVDLVLAPAMNERGRVLFVAATGHDITDRKRAEAALRKSESKIRSIADSAPVLLWETDLGGLTFANQQYLDFFGRSFEELKGLGWAGHLHDNDREEYLKMYDDVYALRIGRVVQMRLRRHDGEYRWLLNSGYPHYSETGEFLGFVGTSIDITDLKKAEETQRRLAEELGRADRQKDEFLALLAHELRNPLAPLQSGIQMIDIAKGDAFALEQAREMMERQLGHLVRLIDDLLDVARLATKKIELRLTRVNLVEIVKSAVETAEPVIAAARHNLTVSLPAEPIPLNVDLTRIAQVISNLLINSAKYTPQGGCISLSASVRDEEVAIVVQDTGVGIPTDALTSIFNMFSQVDRSIERSTGGLGIGLALVKGLVEAHGGQVTAESPGLNAGSTFTITLPLAEAPEEDKVRKALPPVALDVAKHRILVVDDHRDAALGMAAVLKSRHHEVAVAHNGESAVRVAETFRPEAILMDIGMPGMNGYEATRRIRATEWGAKIFIIAVTGWGQETDRAHSQAAGCNAHLVKPVNLPELEELLTRAPAAE